MVQHEERSPPLAALLFLYALFVQAIGSPYRHYLVELEADLNDASDLLWDYQEEDFEPDDTDAYPGRFASKREGLE